MFSYSFICLILLMGQQFDLTPVAFDWPPGCEVVEITSSLDQVRQPAYFFTSDSDVQQPLIVSLHSWSAGYDQADSLAWKSYEKGFNYIHPHFRGPNDNPMACGSVQAIHDMDDAIAFAIEHGNVDTSQIHIIGSSGGGYATLLSYMKSRYRARSYSAWVPISNLVDWYYESVGRENKYANDIAQVTNPEGVKEGTFVLNVSEAKSRSPYYMQTPILEREGSQLSIYAGIHDGYEGSVPITQSLKFYNKVVRDFASQEKSATISIGEMLSLLERRNARYRMVGESNRGDIHFQRSFNDDVFVYVFEGGHEMLIDRAFADLIKSTR
ncbi:MAG: prolyl oligopeptidase family serine peptidase [Saprospiraceae bacterium]|nr:prolyl oligopeptidase family serine peptidase [Saprospiraceae bacterium]